MNDLIVLTVKKLKTKLNGKPSTLLQRYSHPESESLRIYDVISVQQLLNVQKR